MSKLIERKIYTFLFSLLPISIVIGSAVSLVNIILICLSYLIFFFIEKDFSFLKNISFLLLLVIFFYLILNTFFALDFQLAATRNFGFLRFILIFIIINHFFYNYKSFSFIYKIWLFIILVILFDSYVEFWFGKNTLGFGEDYGDRIVSFFQDEPVVAAFLNGFCFLLIGYLFDRYYEKNFYLKFFFYFFVIAFLMCIILTGERSNAIKGIFGLFIFFSLNNNISLKSKILTIFGILTLFSLISYNSAYVKYRFFEAFINPLVDKKIRSDYLKKNIYINLYKSGFEVFKKYPILGVGNKNYRIETSNNKNNDKYKTSTHPHQIYIEFLSEHGLLGTTILLVLFFFLMFKNLKTIINSRNSIQLGAFSYLCSVFLPLLPSGSFFSDFNITLFFMNISIMYACNPHTNIFKKKHKI